MHTFSWPELPAANLVVDACYQGQRKGNAGDDPLGKLLGVSIQGGFRYLGQLESPRLVVIKSSHMDPDWPDELDPETGVFTYFGDNKKPGRELHDTPRFGNRLLRNSFALAASGPAGRAKTPPVLIFSRAGAWRDVIFRGIAVPGISGARPGEDLVAVWRSKAGQRFQNYRALFSILDAPTIKRAWLDGIKSGPANHGDAPEAWQQWVATGKIRALTAKPTVEIRTREQQLPQDDRERRLLKYMVSHFASNHFAFEYAACRIAKLYLGNVQSIDLTQPRKDGGRDAVGNLWVGAGSSAITVEFAMEAKCYGSNSSVGVKEMARLISRLRHRQFGVMVTTSFVNSQAYREIKEDKHPIVVLCGKDIVDILVRNNIASEDDLRAWLLETDLP